MILVINPAGTVAISADTSALTFYEVLELYARQEEQTTLLAAAARAWRLEADRGAIVRFNGAADVLVVGRESIPVYDLTISSISYRAAGPLLEGTLRLFGRR